MEKKEEELPLWQSMVAASTGALVTALVLNPIDVIKVTMQAQENVAEGGVLSSLRAVDKTCPRCGRYPSSWATMANEPRPGEASSFSGAFNGAFRDGKLFFGGIFRRRASQPPSLETCSHIDAWKNADLLKTRAPAPRLSVWSTVRSIIHDAGVFGLWRGLSASVLTIVPATGLYFGLYEQSTQYVIRQSAADSHLADPVYVAPVTGAVMRCVVATAVSPLEMARTSMQANGGSMWQTLRRTMQVGGGARALWSGLAATLWRDAPFSAIYWGVYESLKVARSTVMRNKEAMGVDAHQRHTLDQRWDQSAAIRSSYHFVSGVIAGMTAAVVTNPADVVKTRNQSWPGALSTPSLESHGETTGARYRVVAVPTQRFWPALRHLLRQEGFRGLFRGVVPRVIKVIPASGIMMVTFEEMKRWFAHSRISMDRSVDAALESSTMSQAR
jgi:solute carrier family 25 protein 39/40